MAFPTTPVLTGFTGADENPLSEGGTWSNPIRNGGRLLERIGNAVGHGGPGDNAATGYYNVAQFGGDLESYLTVPVLPDAASGIAAWGRIHNPNNATTMEAYLAVYTTGTGFRLFKCTAGATFTQLGSTDATAMTAGEKLGLECIDTTIRCLHFTGGSWVQRVSATDSAITGAGFIGIEFSTSNGTGTGDDFGGGTVVVGSLIRSQYIDYDYSR